MNRSESNKKIERFFYDSNEKLQETSYLVLVIYDIPDNRRRTRFAKFLESYGFRVQKSAFEAQLNKTIYETLVASIPQHIGQEDNVRVYKIRGTSEVIAWGSKVEDQEEVIIV